MLQLIFEQVPLSDVQIEYMSTKLMHHGDSPSID